MIILDKEEGIVINFIANVRDMGNKLIEFQCEDILVYIHYDYYESYINMMKDYIVSTKE